LPRPEPEQDADEVVTALREKATAQRYAVLAARQRYREMGVPEGKNIIITPELHPGRFTREERELFAAGRCPWQVEFGTGLLEGDEGYCGAPSRPGASFGHCQLHDDEMLEDFYPDGSRRG
jgi:hypothetical protein